MLLSSTVPSRSALLDWLRPGVSRLMLEEIAANDAGEEVADHLAAIQKQLSDAPQIGPLPWCPREVLELERNDREPDIEFKDDLVARHHRHWKRLLACTLLLQSAATTQVVDRFGPEDFFLDTSAMTLIRLTRSVISIGEDGPRHALGFMLWLYQELTYPPLIPFAAFCGLLLWLECGAEIDCDGVAELSQWVIDEERQYRQMHASKVESERWLVGLSAYEDRLGYRGAWSQTASQALQRWEECGNAMGELRSRLAMMERD